MLKFIKNLFKQEDEQGEKVSLNELSDWVDKKTRPLFESLKKDIDDIIKTIENKKEEVLVKVKNLENAKLQNPNIPNRAKTIMEGNRAAFIKKVSHFINNIDLKYQELNEIVKKCKNLENGIDLLAKSTARSYQILNEFFAREVSFIVENIKKIETSSKEIRNLIDYNKISEIEGIKNNIVDLQYKIKSREKLLREIESEKSNLDDVKNRLSETDEKIKGLVSGEDYKNFERLLKEKGNLEKELKDIEYKLFHDFSVLEKALKKYAKIAFENDKLIEDYLKNSLNALMKDTSLDIIKIMDNLKKAVEGDRLELEHKKNKKTLMKIRELDKNYFTNLQDNHKTKKNLLDKIKMDIENNRANNQLSMYNEDLNKINKNIENLNNKISVLNNELEKINIKNLKESMQKEVNDALNEKITLL